MATKKGIKKDNSDKEFLKLNEKILEIRDSILEEFDMIELIEDSIQDIFSCDLDCSTCTQEEQGKCLQSFKKANIYWLRKIVQDEAMIKDIVVKMEELRTFLIELLEETRDYKKQKRLNDKNIEEHKDRIKNKVKENQGYNIYS